jgi:nucleoside-diphosphate-sugar epimerase
MTHTQHVVLGATGVVGRETLDSLDAVGLPTLAVSRSGADPRREVFAPSHDSPSRAVRPAASASLATDLRDAASVRRALESAEVAYLTVGLPYSARVWRSDWPLVLRNTIAACVASGTHLVYFDNVYAYGATAGPMTESTEIRPSSAKGAVRASLLGMLEEASCDEGLVITVGRSADFYGPGATTSVFNSFTIDRVRADKPPTWLLDAHQPHAMTYTPDIGAALAVLGTDPRARAGVWHLPTAPALTGAEYMALATGGGSSHRTMSAVTLRLGAVFNGAAREAVEMAYQNTAPYLFDSTAYERTFGVGPTPYAEGIRATLAAG